MILLDTGPLVALSDPGDALHRRACRELDRLARWPLVLCAPVLSEACFLLRHRVQRERLLRLIRQLSVSAYVGEDEAGRWYQVLGWLIRYQEHAPDWTDGYLAVVSGQERASRVWTYDREFHTTWRRPDGTRIPLAVN